MRKLIFISLFGFCCFLFPQTESIEVFLIDSYTTSEKPVKFILTFFTSEKCKSRIIFDNRYSIEVSENISEEHRLELDLTKYHFDKKSVQYEILLAKNKIFKSAEKVELELNYEMDISPAYNTSLFKMCCIGGTFFGVPSPSYIRMNNKDYFAVTKQIPVLTFYNEGFNKPSSYFSIEYTHIFLAERGNYLRVGYNQLFYSKFPKYISPEIQVLTDFSGYNGISAGVSAGLFDFTDTFTFFTKLRYNYKPGGNGKLDFFEFSIGLYSSFFSLNL